MPTAPPPRHMALSELLIAQKAVGELAVEAWVVVVVVEVVRVT